MEISCPKCGSHDLHADKKGFSGAKAAAGAALVGGIGLLAGASGSNKIQITCLKCGNVFGPGGRMANGRKPPTAGQYKVARVAFLVFGLLFSLMGIPAVCFSESRGIGVVMILLAVGSLFISRFYGRQVNSPKQK